MINHTANNNATDKLKTALAKEAIQNLFVVKNHQFDLSTEEGIHYAVNYTVDHLLQQKIENGEIQVLATDNSIGTTR
jgi:hypothetical protein